jgi:hypothetical protein
MNSEASHINTLRHSHTGVRLKIADRVAGMRSRRSALPGDRAALWGVPELGVGGSLTRAAGFDLSEAAVARLSARWVTSREVAEARISEDTSAGEAGEG